MDDKTTAIWFSPTGGTRAYVKAVAAALPGPAAELDLTRPAVRREEHTFTAHDLVVIGVPVYYGRVPAVPGMLDGLRGEDTPAVLLAVYGTRTLPADPTAVQWTAVAILAGGLVVLRKWKVNPVWVILGSGLVGILAGIL